MTLQFKLLRRARGARRLWNNKRGNIAIITALMMIPLTFALGMAYDFTMAESRQDQINGMADVATLGGVTPSMMGQPNSTAVNFSLNLFKSQLATVNGVTYNVTDIDTTGSGDVASGVSVTRTVEITYKAASVNIFAKLLGMDTFPLHGSSTATSATAPNIDFYLMMDTSPSMEIAATSAGIATMIANTQQESDGTSVTDTWGSSGIYNNGGKFAAVPKGNGCAFGCHQTQASDLTPSSGCVSHIDPATPAKPATTACQFLAYNSVSKTWNKIPCTVIGAYADGTTFTTASTFPETGRDNYDLSRCLGVTLRIDLLNEAAQNLMDLAKLTAANDNAVYRMALYETAYNNQASPLTLYPLQPLTPDLTAAKASAATLKALTMCSNNNLACGDGNGDMDTDLDGNLATMNSKMPNPGNGTNNAGDTPQEMLFIVTDGLNDKNSGGRKYWPMDTQGAKLCKTIRDRGIKIAVLYTTYMPLEESWYQGQVESYLGFSGAPPNPFDDKLADAAQACATPATTSPTVSPSLFSQVSTDGDISAALNKLFQEAVSSARLLK